MDRRRLRIIALLVVGIIVLVIGVRAITIYSGPVSWAAWWDVAAEIFFDKSGEDLTYDESDWIKRNLYDGQEAEAEAFARRLDLERRNAEFRDWLLQWIVRPLGLFAILTAALVASRLILSRSRPPPDSG